MKKIFFVLIFIFLIPQIIQSAGLVPCGGKDEPPCQLCHLFVMLDNIVDFVLIKLVPPLAVLMVVIGGTMFLLAGGNPGILSRANSLLTAVFIGLVIVYGSWIIINIFFTLIGVSEWTGLSEGWFKINCPI